MNTPSGVITAATALNCDEACFDGIFAVQVVQQAKQAMKPKVLSA